MRILGALILVCSLSTIADAGVFSRSANIFGRRGQQRSCQAQSRGRRTTCRAAPRQRVVVIPARAATPVPPPPAAYVPVPSGNINDVTRQIQDLTALRDALNRLQGK